MSGGGKMRIYTVLSLLAYVVLASFAVWFGGLNQDEGWYLYAANMVSDGAMMYRDFFFTQAPVMPIVYSAFTGIWSAWGVLGARIFTAAIGFAACLFAMGTARRLADDDHKGRAALITFLLLGCNLYHLYFTAIPKTYALASLFLTAGFYLLTFRSTFCVFGGAMALAFAAGTRISLGAVLPVVGIELLCRREWKRAVVFAAGGFIALALVYVPFLADGAARDGLFAAQAYHTARGGFDPVFTIGSISRLVRWYLPAFLIFTIGRYPRTKTLLFSFLAVLAVQMLAPFPYEDYQVPVMAIFAIHAAVNFRFMEKGLFPVLALVFACAFGNPLLEKWMTDGQDRFWTIKKEKSELAQLRDVARRIDAEDPDGTDILTQDTYLAIELGRKVPKGLEMGPFSMLTDEEWRHLLGSAPCRIAAFSGYAFAINPPVCDEVPIDTQIAYWEILKSKYDLIDREERFGQNATTLLVLKRK